MNETPPAQRPLELTPAMSVVMAVVLLIGWLGWMGEEDDQAPTLAPRPVIKRVSNQIVRIPKCSLSLSIPSGWSHLSIRNMIDEKPTFVNQSTQTIATFEPSQQLSESSGREVQYEHVKIVWHQRDQEIGGASLLEGSIQDHPMPVRIRILTRGKSIDDDPSIAALCNAIRADH